MIKRLLLIDDDPDDADIFGTALREVDYNSIFHYLDNSKTAMELLRRRKVPVPDIIFMDINMPLLNGLDCLRELKSVEFLKQVPVVMYSTSYLPKDLNAAVMLGAIAFWTKPTRYMELIRKLRELAGSLHYEEC